MKAKKSNAMWGVMLFLILGFAYFLNATDFLSKPLFPEAPKQDDKAGGPSVAQTNEAIRGKLQQNRVPASEDGSPAAPTPPQGIPAQAAIFKPKVKRYDPVVNETATSAQWYKKDNYIDEKAKEVKEKRGY
jgi:hypothetical protein